MAEIVHRAGGKTAHAPDATSLAPDAQADSAGRASAAIRSATAIARRPVQRSGQLRDSKPVLATTGSRQLGANARHPSATTSARICEQRPTDDSGTRSRRPHASTRRPRPGKGRPYVASRRELPLHRAGMPHQARDALCEAGSGHCTARQGARVSAP